MRAKRPCFALCAAVSMGALAMRADAAPVRLTHLFPRDLTSLERPDAEYLRQPHNLKLVFAATSGIYLAGVKVQIRDRRGALVVDTVSARPILLINLKPGTYAVTATADSGSKVAAVRVEESLMNTYRFYIPVT